MKEVKNSKECYSGLVKELKELKAKTFKYVVQRSCNPYGAIEYMTKDNVVAAFSSICQAIDNKKKAAEELGLDPAKIKTVGVYQGYTKEEWKADFMTRLEQIQVEHRIKKLEKNCPELLEILAEEEKKSLILEKINEDLDDEE